LRPGESASTIRVRNSEAGFVYLRGTVADGGGAPTARFIEHRAGADGYRFHDAIHLLRRVEGHSAAFQSP
jgi:hypothetical protein